MEKVVVGMSGGIDSTLTAIKLKEKGYQVIGVTLQMWDSVKTDVSIKDARIQAQNIDIEHHVVDCRDEFKTKVVKGFVNSYLKGETPSPCAWCNPTIKWKQLTDFADSIGVTYISSGHYVRTVKHNNHYYIEKGVDPVKDQSYYLWMLPESIIKRMVQPLGGITKEQTKQEIKDRNFDDLVPNLESMSVCFLSGMDYRDFLLQISPDEMSKVKPGMVLDEEGNTIGTHNGLPFYTVGQKRGLMLDIEREAYIQTIDSNRNAIVVGKKVDLLRSEFQLRDIHLINAKEVTPSTPLEVKVRGYGLNPAGNGYLTIEGNIGTVRLENPAWAISPGQPAVFYIDNRLIGGGFAL